MKAIGKIGLICILLAFSGQVFALEKKPADMVGVGIIEEIGTPIPPTLSFTNESGQTVLLRDYLKLKRPLVINFVYFNCPMLCNLVVTGLVNSLKGLDDGTLSKFDVLTISFNPKNTPQEATEYKQKYAKELGKPFFDSHWHFLTGTPDAIQYLTDITGFKYKYLPDQNEFSHPSALILIDQNGKIVRYLYGIEYRPFDLKMGLLESRKSSSISAIDQALLLCYNYDPGKNSYVLQARTLMKVGAAVTVLAIVAFLILINIRKKV